MSSQSSTPVQIDRYAHKRHTVTLGNDIISHDVYRRGSGPIVVLIQELPGIGQETLRLADMLIDDGFEVVLPHLFGPLGKTATARNFVNVFCMRREFKLFRARRSSPIVDWLRALCVELQQESGGASVGVMGMCLTGNFALTLIADDSVGAAVAAQPAMPLLRQKSLHMSAAQIRASKDRLDSVGPMLAYRFDNDKLCQAAKFEKIKSEFNQDGVQRVQLETLPGDGHSVFTLDFCDQQGHPAKNAYHQVVAYFKKALA